MDRLSSYELKLRIEQNEAVYRCCRPELETLRRAAAGGDGVAIVADPSGLVLDSVGAEDFSRRVLEVELCPGWSWNERLRGTNGIGAVLMELKPLIVRGAEHFLQPNRFLDCAAAPIMTPFGSVAGVLNLSVPSSMASAYALGLVELAIDQIEHRQFAGAFTRYQVVRLHTERELLGTPKEGVLVFDGSRLVAANRYGLAVLNLDWKALGQRSFGELFDAGSHEDPARHLDQLRSSDGRLLHSAKPDTRTLARSVPSPPELKRVTLTRPIYDVAMRTNIERALRVMECGVPIVLSGETGCGKEVFARHLHALSSRATHPFVAVNCAGLPESLIEAELFGYLEGAFTGARKSGSKGLVREADGGVLLLDEIGDMPLPAQARLLRVLQEREVVPLGGSKPVPVDFMLICASHLKLEDMVAAKRFRQDLYYRISQFHLRLKPLREHVDLDLLLKELWLQTTSGDQRYTLASATVQLLARYDWPGNYRQLVGVLRTLFALAEPMVDIPPSALPQEIRDAAPEANATNAQRLQAKTTAILKDVLDQHGGNVSRAAKSLGISRGTFYRRLIQSKGE
ncbi:sigma-54-dependent Fis family transcriptional regulator [Hyphomicrobium sp.]|uniref:sigma-54-dependent Fis family transcriptional regulator n=1 Tax=Hyphomicrobium sp. TaxID=82 RepID=UPI0025C012DD|nr:sigma-54-dependent Fis family transcriptional regulator [Hyphomicrobium sp.]MCC7254101.1 sigma-54-dependent Fis family transcriptional regulator [Hyphomicrobium sp.]